MATQFEPSNPKAARACFWAVLALLCLAAAIPAKAQEGGAIAGGVAALNSGKYDSAVRQLSTAIASSSITPGEAAKALYLRGIAYRKMNQPARSISDLGAAMWLGLPPSDRLKAQVNRGLAYRAAGLAEQGEAELAAAKKSNSEEVARLIAEDGGATSNNTAIAAFSTEVRAADAGSSSAASNNSGPSFSSTVTAANTPPPGRAADASPNWSTSVSNAPSTAAPPPPREEKAPAPGSWSTTTTDASAESSSSGSSRVGRWINSWKGDSNSDSPPPQAESAPPPRAATEAPSRPQAAPSSGWDAQTQIVTADARPAGATDSGSYTLQLTASRSQEEAQALYNKVAKQNPALASKQPDIQKTDLGGLGTFYRLQIGPFPDKAESLKLCNALKRSGVDCFLVTR
jgi:hypothetical protein